MNIRIPKNIINLVPYKAGKPIEELRRESKLKSIIKLASNENPFVSQKALRAIRMSLSKINRYPESSCFYLKEQLSKKLKLKKENIVFGNGSDELIDVIIKTFVAPDEEIFTSKTSFLEYEIMAKVNNRKVKTVALKDFKYDLAGIKEKISKKTKVIFIANPNNPTGTYVNKKEVEEFLRDLPKKIIIVFDEAYKEFVGSKDFPDTQKYLKSRNVIILRTFSKVYGLAGLRIGYALANKKFINFMERVRPPFNVNSLAQSAALAALSDSAHITRSCRLISGQKKYIYKALNKMGIFYVPSAANFILINVKKNTLDAFHAMLAYGVIVRDMGQYGLSNFIRVTIGREKENKRFIQALKRIVK